MRTVVQRLSSNKLTLQGSVVEMSRPSKLHSVSSCCGVCMRVIRSLRFNHLRSVGEQSLQDLTRLLSLYVSHHWELGSQQMHM